MLRLPFNSKKGLNSGFKMLHSSFFGVSMITFLFLIPVLSFTGGTTLGAGLSTSIPCSFNQIFLQKDELDGSIIDSYQHARDLSDTIDHKLVNLERELGIARARLEIPQFEEAWLELSFYRLFSKLKDQPAQILYKHFQKLFDLQRESIRRRDFKIDQTSVLVSGRYEFNESEARRIWEVLLSGNADLRILQDSTRWSSEIVEYMADRLKDYQENELTVFNIPFCCGLGKSPKCKLCPVGRGLISSSQR